MSHDLPQSAIKRDLLDGYAKRWGAPFVVQMIDLFLQESPARLAAAEHGLAAGDPASVGAAAHALKSSAGNLGAVALMNQMAALEQAARAGEAAETLAPMVAHMAEELDRVRASLLELRVELAP